ncbi:MAG: hypothetical protein HKN13_06110 [Rhodothermales bacterium]|nr:hypothetical protein [Rhodothermales bacterium]
MKIQLLTLLAVVCFGLLGTAASTSAQSGKFIDGFTVGTGIGVYAGDLDGNPSSSIPVFVGNGHLTLYGGVDKHLGGAIGVGLELHYNRLRGVNEFVDGAHDMLSTELMARIMPFRAIGFYMGVAPAFLRSRYSRLSASAVLDGEATEGSRFVFTVPVGLIIQENIRLGLRFSASDLLDGKASGSNNDVLGTISVGYHIRHK